MRSSVLAIAIAAAGCGSGTRHVSDGGVDLAPVDLLPAAAVTIGISHATAVATLDSSFIGFSYEKSTLSTQLFSADNKPLVALFRRLGPSSLRLGGFYLDQTSWNGSGTGGVSGQIAPADVDRLAAFVKATGWKVIYGLNLAASSTPTAATGDEAAYATQALGSSLFAFEIGNEPDAYVIENRRPATWSYADFQGEWQAYVAAVRARVNGALFAGPATATPRDAPTWTLPFAAAEGAQLALLTQHYYIADGRDPASTIDKLLAPNPMLTSVVAEVVAAAQKAKIPGGARLGETNSFFAGGAPGVSDAYASALWVIDFAFQVAAAGASGLNLHGGGNGPGYTPIANDAGGKILEARPEYYGVTLFALAANGTMRATSIGSGAIALSAYAVDENDGVTAVVLVNRAAAQPVRATIDLGRAATSATLLALTGTALASTSGERLGGAPIAADGSWNPPPLPSLPVTGASLTVDVAPASAVLVRAK